ncbi:PREDICTED: transcriptional regulator SUPERMAN-like [Nelumbo nucifera]|uniref:C2H2-type domain-containing protein n=2 Tax=Nelumbo nucifera TaxID=4432 RepID=A0A822Z5C4_NELNU|nr:PREDICTED: transcriptional regulator SUPERMAN-like [Nelumbo nucifera]DAD36728.1 TPA_asm: hypothetical protein HUJ06_007369 [Nelumbo nucifera]
MESSHEDSKTSSEDGDQQDHQDDASTGRSYRCVFCKRGFTTAQALGGHMNIHRKERARIRQPAAPSVSNKPDGKEVCPEFPPPSSSRRPLYPPTPDAQRSYHVYFPPSSSSSSAGTRHPQGHHAGDEFYIRKPQSSSLFEDDCNTNLCLQIGPVHTNYGEEEKKREAEEVEPDLELRLGHDP